uniref:Small ribosomal subunit protein uS15c n=2 Tax=Vittaria TaxID=32183 RepID=A0A3G5CUR3_9MONI|nr:ribosomal protein S15 [Vittaria graminifolia]YP_009549502.1 ribosomal protein S15 [Vittaria appalachiana]AYW16470.1 ribosomal protein S15 [Vittaria graminifolia]AYW16651.1 ribosomal protein S15 [Vittaria appalachiana]
MKERESINSYLASRNGNTGFTASQIYYLTSRVSKLTSHLQLHPKDYSSQIGLWKLLGKRKRLLAFLSNENTNLFTRIVKELGLRGLKGH